MFFFLFVYAGLLADWSCLSSRDHQNRVHHVFPPSRRGALWGQVSSLEKNAKKNIARLPLTARRHHHTRAWLAFFSLLRVPLASIRSRYSHPKITQTNIVHPDDDDDDMSGGLLSTECVTSRPSLPCPHPTPLHPTQSPSPPTRTRLARPSKTWPS